MATFIPSEGSLWLVRVTAIEVPGVRTGQCCASSETIRTVKNSYCNQEAL